LPHDDDQSRVRLEIHVVQDIRMDDILARLKHLSEGIEHIMTTFAEVQAAVTAEDSVIDGAVALLNQLAALVKALPPDQAAIDALAADITAKTTALSEAITANTGAVPGPVAPGTAVRA
jgi:ABC-type transporter Mla subunit MlaD